MKWAYDYENLKPAYIDKDGYNWSENRLMETGTYDEEDVEDDNEEAEEDKHEYGEKLLESDEEQAMMCGWFQNESYNNTYGMDSIDPDADICDESVHNDYNDEAFDDNLDDTDLPDDDTSDNYDDDDYDDD